MSNPEFSYTAVNPFGLKDVGMLATPSFVDIDDDGDLDAFIGEVFGDTFFIATQEPLIILCLPLQLKIRSG